eukprot:Gb_24354 [translate_table: standard]
MRNRPAVINRKKFMNGDPISECFAATQSEAIARTQKRSVVREMGHPPNRSERGGDFEGLGMKKGGANKGKATNVGKIGAQIDRKDPHSRLSPYDSQMRAQILHFSFYRVVWLFVKIPNLQINGDEIPLFVVDPEMPTRTSDGIRPSRSRIEDRGYSAIYVLLYLILEASGDSSRRRPFLVVQQQSEDELVHSRGEGPQMEKYKTHDRKIGFRERIGKKSATPPSSERRAGQLLVVKATLGPMLVSDDKDRNEIRGNKNREIPAFTSGGTSRGLPRQRERILVGSAIPYPFACGLTPCIRESSPYPLPGLSLWSPDNAKASRPCLFGLWGESSGFCRATIARAGKIIMNSPNCRPESSTGLQMARVVEPVGWGRVAFRSSRRGPYSRLRCASNLAGMGVSLCLWGDWLFSSGSQFHYRALGPPGWVDDSSEFSKYTSPNSASVCGAPYVIVNSTLPGTLGCVHGASYVMTVDLPTNGQCLYQCGKAIGSPSYVPNMVQLFLHIPIEANPLPLDECLKTQLVKENGLLIGKGRVA